MIICSLPCEKLYILAIAMGVCSDFLGKKHMYCPMDQINESRPTVYHVRVVFLKAVDSQLLFFPLCYGNGTQIGGCTFHPDPGMKKIQLFHTMCKTELKMGKCPKYKS